MFAMALRRCSRSPAMERGHVGAGVLPRGLHGTNGGDGEASEGGRGGAEASR
jgi:hypothetical protein